MIYFFIDSARIIIAVRRIVVEEILTIIVADDNAYMSDFMSKIIKEDSRFKFIGFAKDEKEEIELINSLKPNVVITDLKKGNKWTGIDIIKEVQDNNEIAPIFFVTSASIYYYYDKLKELKIRYFLNKPFDIEQVKEVLNRIYDDVFPKQIVELTENKKIETNNNIFFNKLRRITKNRIGHYWSILFIQIPYLYLQIIGLRKYQVLLKKLLIQNL